MVTGTGNPSEGNALPRTEVKAEEGSVKLPSQVSQSWRQNIFQKKMWKGFSSVGSKFILSIDYVDNTLCSTLGVGNNSGDRNNVKNIRQETFSDDFIERQNTYENSDGEKEAKEQEDKEKSESEQENESEETENEDNIILKNKEKEGNKENNKNKETKENKEGNNVKEKESNHRNYSEADDNELHELHALNSITNSPNNYTGSTITKRGSLRLSFEAAMSLRRRNLSLKEQNLTA